MGYLIYLDVPASAKSKATFPGRLMLALDLMARIQGRYSPEISHLLDVGLVVRVPETRVFSVAS